MEILQRNFFIKFSLLLKILGGKSFRERIKEMTQKIGRRTTKNAANIRDFTYNT